jgi:hypothetical protein
MNNNSLLYVLFWFDKLSCYTSLLKNENLISNYNIIPVDENLMHMRCKLQINDFSSSSSSSSSIYVIVLLHMIIFINLEKIR